MYCKMYFIDFYFIFIKRVIILILKLSDLTITYLVSHVISLPNSYWVKILNVYLTKKYSWRSLIRRSTIRCAPVFDQISNPRQQEFPINDALLFDTLPYSMKIQFPIKIELESVNCIWFVHCNNLLRAAAFVPIIASLSLRFAKTERSFRKPFYVD